MGHRGYKGGWGPTYLHPVTRQFVRRLPSQRELEGFVNWVVDHEKVYTSERAGKYQLAVGLWQFYERGCEEYDRLVCTGRTETHEGITAMPQNGFEQSQVNLNARYQHMLLVRRALNLRIPDELLTRAKNDPSRWRWEEWAHR